MVGHRKYGSGTPWVNLNQETGIVTVNRPVDRERDCGKDNSLNCIIKVIVSTFYLHEILKTFKTYRKSAWKKFPLVKAI